VKCKNKTPKKFFWGATFPKKVLFWGLKNKKEDQEQYLRKENPCPSLYKKFLRSPTLRGFLI
jgi:hypothetical protein